jgi:branched-chain amino acid transport system permease protein
MLAIETIVHYTVNAGDDPNTKAFGIPFDASSPITWVVAAVLIIVGFFLARKSWTRVGRAWDDATTVAREKGVHA